jgi:hypothetical protein
MMGKLEKCFRCGGDKFISGKWPDMPDEPCPECNKDAPSGADRVAQEASRRHVPEPAPIHTRVGTPGADKFAFWVETPTGNYIVYGIHMMNALYNLTRYKVGLGPTLCRLMSDNE